MKKIFFALLFLLISVSTYSQEFLKNKASISGNLGIFLPYSSELYNTGFNLGVEAEYNLLPIFIIADITYNTTSRHDNRAYQSYTNLNNSSILEITGGSRIFFGESKLKYFTDLSLGIYSERKGGYEIKIHDTLFTQKANTNFSVGGNIGFGVIFPLNKDFDIFAKAKYHLYFGIGDDPFLNTYFGIYGGIKYYFK